MLARAPGRLVVLCGAVAIFALACSRSTANSLTIAVVAGVEGDALKAAAGRYRELHPSLGIEIVELPYSSLFEKILLDVTFGTGAYDVIMMDDPWFPRLAEHEKLTALEPLLAGDVDPDFIPACIAVCREPYQSGRLYALPYVGNSQLYFYRQDLFEKYGLAPPKTWQDVLAAAQKIQQCEEI